MSIFETNREPLTDELDSLLRKLLKQAMAFHGMNEETLAAELSKRLGHTVTPGLVSAWKAETKHRWHLPANLVPLICEILGDDSIQRLLLSDKLRRALNLGESASRIVLLLRDALSEEGKVEGQRKPQGRSKR